MLLADPAALAVLVGQACRQPAAGDSLSETLAALQSRIEGAMNVKTLEYGSYTDIFWVYPNATRSRLWLSNGYVQKDSVVFNGPDGIVDHRSMDYDHGIVTPVSCLYPGEEYSVTYTSGFEAVPPTGAGFDYPERLYVAQNVPKWISPLLAVYLVQCFRSLRLGGGSIIQKDVKLATLVESTARELQASLYTHYMRPRYDTIMPSRFDVNA